MTLNHCIAVFLDTPLDGEIREIEHIIKKNVIPFQSFYNQQENQIRDLLRQAFPQNSIYTSKHINNFMRSFHSHMDSEAYRQSALSLLSFYGISSPACSTGYKLLTNVLFYLKKTNLESVCDSLELHKIPILKKISDDMSPEGRGKVRYIAGYVIAKLRFRISRKIKNALYVKGKECLLKKLTMKMEILNSMTVSYEELLSSTGDNESLQETARKQNSREGLTNVKDQVFNFFMQLEKRDREKFSYTGIIEHGKSLYKHTLNEVKSDMMLFGMWTKVVKDCSLMKTTTVDEKCESDEIISALMIDIVETCDASCELFDAAMALFLKVSLSQFRRDFLTSIRQSKVKALRKKVVEKSKSKESILDMKFIQMDSSTSKSVSHLRMKAEIIQNNKCLMKFTKKELSIICKAYGIKMSNQRKKDVISSKLKEHILQCSDIPHPEELGKNPRSSTPVNPSEPVSSVSFSVATASSEIHTLE